MVFILRAFNVFILLIAAKNLKSCYLDKVISSAVNKK